MWEKRQNQPIHPDLIPYILIPIIRKIIILLKRIHIIQQSTFIKKYLHKILKRYAKNIGL